MAEFGYDITLRTAMRNSGIPRMVYRSLFAACALLAVSACSYVPRIVTEYRIDVQQGNVITQEMVSQLKPGQTRDQVRFILGTPMLADMFHADRWDYFYSLQNGRTGAIDKRRFSVFFDKEGRLERASGDVEVATAADLNTPVAKMQVIDLGSVPADGKPLPPPEEKGFFGRMLEKVGL